MIFLSCILIFNSLEEYYLKFVHANSVNILKVPNMPAVSYEVFHFSSWCIYIHWKLTAHYVLFPSGHMVNTHKFMYNLTRISYKKVLTLCQLLGINNEYFNSYPIKLWANVKDKRSNIDLHNTFPLHIFFQMCFP